jgi:DNA-binding NarL/FixJ family response regulator
VTVPETVSGESGVAKPRVPAQPGATDGAEPIRVLIVDDHALFRRGLEIVLGQEDDIEVVGEANDGEEAVAQAAELLPDIVLMDVRMPRRGGIEACSALKSVAPSARIVMLTMSDEEADLYEAVKAGATGYLLKEIPPHEVADAVRSVYHGQSLISPAMASKLLTEFASMIKSDETAERQVPAPKLTDRELEVLKLVATGLNNRAVAEQLVISENTVKNHVRNILEKLQLHSRMEAVMYAVREKILEIG